MKKLAAHQTYFFPYLGYFSVMNTADYYVCLDSFQYERYSWMNRNRVIFQDGQVKYIIVPTKKASRETSTNLIEIDYDQAWEEKIISQLGYYRKKAPYYNDVVGLLDKVFSAKCNNIADIAMLSSKVVTEYLNMNVDSYKFSELRIETEEKPEPDDWGILICNKFPDVGTYINAPGGKSFYNSKKYEEAGLKINFIQNRLRPYDQKNNNFIPGLSIIDVMMFNSPEEVMGLINDCYIL